MHKTVVIDVVGLTEALLPSAPRLSEWASRGARARVRAAFPAVTCTAQSDYLTGQRPATHGIVANGWYQRDECEVRFWRQSNRLVQAPKIWETARAAGSVVHLRERVLVVQHVLHGGLQRHAAADVSGRRTKAPRRLYRTGHAAPRASAAARHVSSLQFLGAARVDRVEPLDRAMPRSTSSASLRRR